MMHLPSEPCWIISVPAWGDRCVRLACGVALPSIAQAARKATREPIFIVHTDQPDAFRGHFGGFRHEIRPSRTDALSPMDHLGVLHREALEMARPGDYFAPLNADQLLSREVFQAVERRFAEGKRLFMYAAPRTVVGRPPGFGCDASNIIDFFLANPHQMVVDATWGSPGTFHPSVIYQRFGDNACCNAFHQHPVALVVPEKPIQFVSTVDNDMVCAFSRDQTHVVTDPAEMAMAEMSPPEKLFDGTHGHEGPPGAIVLRSLNWIAQWGMGMLPMHRWFFSHRVMYRGVDEFDDDPVSRIIRLMDEAELDAATEREMTPNAARDGDGIL